MELKKATTWLKDNTFNLCMGVALILIAGLLIWTACDQVRLQKCDELCDPVTAEQCHHESWGDAAIEQACGKGGK